MNSKKTRSKTKEEMESMYKNVMQDFDPNHFSKSSDTLEDGLYYVLYAQGYDNMGIGDIVAELK